MSLADFVVEAQRGLDLAQKREVKILLEKRYWRIFAMDVAEAWEREDYGGSLDVYTDPKSWRASAGTFRGRNSRARICPGGVWIMRGHSRE